MTPEDLAALRRAVRSLEHPDLAARLTNMVGKPIELIGHVLPTSASHAIATATSKGLEAALKVALSTMQRTPHAIGSISFTNGTFNNGTEIFGATLVLYAHNGSLGNIPIGSLDFRFTGTINDGTMVQNADYLNVQGISNSFNAFEGDTLTGAINGIIIGDPQSAHLFFTLDPNQGGNGFLGPNLPAPASTPLPSTWTMMLIGLVGLGFGAYRRQKQSDALATA